MIKKPKINLTITTSYDSISDRYVLQKQKLIKQIIKQANSKINTINIVSVDLLEDIYKEKIGKLEDIKQKLEKKYKQKSVFMVEYKKELIDRCIKIQNVHEDELKSLALKRGKIIIDYMVDKKGLKPQRFIQKNEKPLKQNSEFIEIKLDLKAKTWYI